MASIRFETYFQKILEGPISQLDVKSLSLFYHIRNFGDAIHDRGRHRRTLVKGSHTLLIPFLRNGRSDIRQLEAHLHYI